MAEADYWEAFASGSLYRQTTYGTGRPAKTKPLGRIVSSTPTAEQLRKHAERFGPEGVAEIAAAYGIDMSAKSIAPKPKRRRRTTPGIKAQVAELHARGMIPAAIADTLNLADRRVKELLAA